jgi:hypothetical protein
MELNNKIKQAINSFDSSLLTREGFLKSESISLLEDIIKINKSNFCYKINKTMEAMDPKEMARLKDIALLQYDLITEYFLSNQGAGSYYFNNPITAKVIQQFNLKKIITKIKKPHSPLPFNDKLFVKYYCYYYKTLRAYDNKLVFSVGTHSDKVVIFFSSSVEFMEKEIFSFWQ